jgi:transcription-repair coupling factor (superfamily II helicase)
MDRTPQHVLIESLRGLPDLSRILDAEKNVPAPGPGTPPNRYHVHKLTGSSRTLLAAALRKATNRPLLYVAPTAEQAEAARDDFEFWLGTGSVTWFAEHDQAPYDTGTPNTEPLANRIETLVRLVTAKDGVFVISARAIAQQVVGPDVLAEAVITVEVGTTLDVEEVSRRLTYLGYRRVPMVEDVGDFSRRGGILDIYSPGGGNPIRIEIDDDFIASMREFDVLNQRSIRPLERVALIPTREIVLSPDRLELALLELEDRDPLFARELKETFEADLYPQGVERLAPWLLQDLGSFGRYLPAGTIVVEEEPGLVASAVESQWDEANAAFDRLRKDLPHLPAPDQLYRSPSEVRADLDNYTSIRLSALSSDSQGAASIAVRSTPPENFGRNLKMWQDYLTGLHEGGDSVWLLCDNPGQKNRLEELLLDNGVPVRLELGVLAEGFRLHDLSVTVLTDHEFFGRVRRQRRARRFKSGFGLKEISTLRPGTYIVHAEHGIGIYRGIKRLEVNGHLTDCLLLEYGAGDKLYLPVDQLDIVQKYSSEEGAKPSLSRLGGTGWSKAKEKAKKAIKEMAGELIALYARRKAHPGHPFGSDTVWQQELEGTFPFDETPDQLKAIDDVRNDMEAATPMDRLVCGDVGYGKTEVAVRAAFKAVMDGRQVAVLVPTTILAQQHFNTFRERYADFPVTVELLSRFRTKKEQDAVIKGTADGTVNVVIGTHALLGKRVQFKDLGLVVVDEEQRFGVAHKERLRQVRTQVDVLTLTATPIPRTLNLSLLGARDISAINTPPRDRLPIHTEIVEFNSELIQDALLREADRGGQSFFVHNRIQSIDAMAVFLHKLCPMLRIGVAHGQMAEHQLEKVMLDFIEKKLDVLVSTMIIENGLDIPSVNTLIVNRSDAFGLAQLYQLRGRVGRSNVKAYAYFLVPSRQALTEGAMKRLRAIAEFDELGSGFALAMRDLEIRGAGNLLGAEQHGFVAAVGFDMYCRLLDEAVKELKGLPVEERPEPRLVTDLAAFFPDEYVQDAEEKIALYKRLADAREPSDVQVLETEMTDRFGRLTPEARALFHLRRLKVLGRAIGAGLIQVRGERIEVEMASPPTQEVVKGWMRRLTIPVEFAAGTRFALKVKKAGNDPLGLAVRLLTEMAGEEPEVARQAAG